jgi:phasin family protein
METFTMNTFNADQFLAAQKASIDALFGMSHKAFASVERLVDLNMQTAKTSLTEATGTAKSMLSVKDAQEFMSLQAGLLQPSAEKLAAYSRHLYDIVAGANAEVVKAAEASVAEGQKTVLSLVDSVTKNAPAGSESAVALMKSAMAAASNAFESVQKATKQATDAAEANFNSLSTQAVKAAQAATVTKARKAA